MKGFPPYSFTEPPPENLFGPGASLVLPDYLLTKAVASDLALILGGLLLVLLQP